VLAAHFGDYGSGSSGVMTDNGSCHRAVVHALGCTMRGIRHLPTRPYRPRTNGKTERFIRTLLGGLSYGALYQTAAQSRRAQPASLELHKRHRSEGRPSRQDPIERLASLRNNLVGSHT
jgi:transposase InsO family protein